MKFAFVTPRYGAEVTAGPEHACRLLAERVAARHDVEVLTTGARDPFTWKNEYSEGSDRVRGVLVRRFTVSQPHDRIGFEQLSARLFNGNGHSRHDELDWLRRLGPWTPGLIDHLKRQHRSYDAVVFFSLLHPTTYHGFAIAPERSVLFPHLTLHPALRFGLWADFMGSVRALGFVSRSERRLARAYLGPEHAPEEFVGVGIDTPQRQTYPQRQQDPADDPIRDEDLVADPGEVPDDTYLLERGVPFRRRHRLYGPFVLYGGRVEPDNGCEEMLEYFETYTETDAETSLVLMGVKMMQVHDSQSVKLAGVLPERERLVAYEAADVTLAPTPDDLIAYAVLQSFAVGTPVLATVRNQEAVEHCVRTGSGLFYANREEFVETLRLLLSDTRLRARMGRNAKQYVQQHYRWDVVLGRFDRLIRHVKTSR